MVEVVNLRTVRKQKKREAGRQDAAASAAKSGEGKAVRRMRQSETALAERRHEGHRRDREKAED